MPTARWSLLSKAPALARSSHALTTTHTGALLLYGGELQPRTPVDPHSAAHIFPVSTTLTPSTWSALSHAPGPSPEPRVGATALWDTATESLYVWGGRGGVDMAPLAPPQTGVWRGSLSGTGSAGPLAWERLAAANEADAPAPRSYHAATLLEGKMYIHAGCPTTGRLNTLHAFDLATRRWASLAPAPEPARGGTSLTAVTLGPDEGPVLIRFGGFAGYELGTEGALDVYNPTSNTWRTLLPTADPVYGRPGARSVHALLSSTSPHRPNALAVLFHGEREPSAAGHAGAGEFWDDVWVLERVAGGVGVGWRRVDVQEGGPEGKGWLAASLLGQGEAEKAVVFGGLLSSNARSDELWALEID